MKRISTSAILLLLCNAGCNYSNLNDILFNYYNCDLVFSDTEKYIINNAYYYESIEIKLNVISIDIKKDTSEHGSNILNICNMYIQKSDNSFQQIDKNDDYELRISLRKKNSHTNYTILLHREKWGLKEIQNAVIMKQ